MIFYLQVIARCYVKYCENLYASKEENTSEDNDLTSEHNVDEPDILMCEDGTSDQKT